MPPNPPPQKPVTLRSLAEIIGVSHVTISLALRGSSHVSPAMRDKIVATADRLGYKPNAMAKALAYRRRAESQSEVRAELGWLNFWPEPEKLRTYSEFNAYWEGAYNAAERGGYRLVEFTAKNDGSLNRIQDIMRARGISGLLVPPHVIKIDWAAFRWDQFTVVKFGYSNPDLRVHMCGSDQHLSALLATRKMFEHGYRRVGFLSNRTGPARTRFLSGYLQGQYNLSLHPPVPPLLLESPAKEEDLATLKNWQKEHRVDAILTDLAEARMELKLIGLRVPADVGLAVLSLLDGNADSGIDQNSFEIGRAAVDLLVSLIHSSQTGQPTVCRQVLVEGRWRDGSSIVHATETLPAGVKARRKTRPAATPGSKPQKTRAARA